MSDSSEFSGEFYRQNQKKTVSFKQQRAAVGVLAREFKSILQSFIGREVSKENIATMKIAVIHALQELVPDCRSAIKFDVDIVGGKKKMLVLVPMNGFTTALFNCVPRV